MKTLKQLLNGLWQHVNDGTTNLSSAASRAMPLFPVAFLACGALNAPAQPAAKSAAIPPDQLGVVAGKQYSGDGLAVVATPQGAHLRCMFQKLEGEATAEGLWLTSTVTSNRVDCFRVKAVSLGRTSGTLSTLNPQLSTQLPATGQITAADKVVRFRRPGLVEEYSVSMDGVRQDFVVLDRPAGTGELRLRLEVTGARVKPAVGGARLALESSGRKIAYGRLHATDAKGRELPARIEVSRSNSENRKQKAEKSQSLLTSAATGGDLTVVVNDAEAEYPVCIDPTFSDANWIGLGGIPGTDGDVNAAVADASGNLYIGGSFNLVGDLEARNVAKWDGASWSALGSGMDGTVYSLAAAGSDLYAGGAEIGGAFPPGSAWSSDGYVAKWDGNSWSALGSAMDDPIYSLAAAGSDVYAGSGGWFYSSWLGSGTWGNVYKWDGSGWSALASMDDAVRALAVSGNGLYAGGDFTSVGEIAVNFLAQWDGSNWSALGSGVDSNVFALAVSGSDLYVGGSFATAGGVGVNHIAKWDGSSWSVLGSGLNGSVSTLTVKGNEVYAGGWFMTAGGIAANHIAKWDGSSWSALSSGTRAEVRALALSGSDLYAGGSGENLVARWNGSSWSRWDKSSSSWIGWDPGEMKMNGAVSALTVLGKELYAGGQFTKAGGVAANHIAKWDGNNWSALRSGMEGDFPDVYALTALGSDLYVGGSFATAGGIEANCIAKWDGSDWSALGSGMRGYVYALAVLGKDVYAGGWFTTAGGVAANHIAKWDGSRWSALGSGMDHEVTALAVLGNEVYAGGWFTLAGGIAANHIAKWDGSRWSALGSGITGGDYPYMSALAVWGSNVYAAGYFTTAGGIAANHIAKWDGTRWSALGSGMSGMYPDVRALALSGSDLCAGGRFTTAGGIAAKCVAKWDGNAWSPLGSGITGGYPPSVSALAVLGSDLFAGGSFTTAGGKVTASIARAIINPGNWLTLQLGVPGPHTNTLNYVGVPGAHYLIQYATNLTTSPWLTLATNTAAADGRGIVQDPSATDPQRYYRVQDP